MLRATYLGEGGEVADGGLRTSDRGITFGVDDEGDLLGPSAGVDGEGERALLRGELGGAGGASAASELAALDHSVGDSGVVAHAGGGGEGAVAKALPRRGKGTHVDLVAAVLGRDRSHEGEEEGDAGGHGFEMDTEETRGVQGSRREKKGFF